MSDNDSLLVVFLENEFLSRSSKLSIFMLPLFNKYFIKVKSFINNKKNTNKRHNKKKQSDGLTFSKLYVFFYCY